MQQVLNFKEIHFKVIAILLKENLPQILQKKTSTHTKVICSGAMDICKLDFKTNPLYVILRGVPLSTSTLRIMNTAISSHLHFKP